MKKLLLSACIILLLFTTTYAQDEGQAVAQARFERSNGIYISGGPALVLGKNLGDYNNGLGLEAGYMKRLNKVLSIGPSISYLRFTYDEEKTYPYYYDPEFDVAIEYYQEGGDLSLVSLGFSIKLNFVPVSDDSKASIYGIATPFFSQIARQEFTATGDFYANADFDGLYNDLLLTEDFDSDDIPQLAKDSKSSGGVHIGFGVEFAPVKPISFFLQATFCYTLAVKYSATDSFLKEEDQYVDAEDTIYYDAYNTIYLEEFPIVNKGFSSLNIKGGISFNF